MSDQPDATDNAEAQSVEELRARLDQLIVKLRATLAATGVGRGNGKQ